MPAPSATTFQRPDLGLAYEELDLMAHVSGFIGLRCMPLTPVGLQTANFSKVKLKDLLSNERKESQGGQGLYRAPGAGYQRSTWDFTQDSYSTDELGVEEILDDRERAAYGYTGVRFEQLAADRAVAELLRAHEQEVQGIVQDATTYSAQVSNAGTEWDTHSSATPVADVIDGKESFKGSCGAYPNAIAMSQKVAQNLVQCDEFRDHLKYVSTTFPGDFFKGPAMASKLAPAIAVALDLEYVFISPAIDNTAGGGDTPVIGDIWDDEYVTLLKVAGGDDLREMTFGRTFAFEQLVLEQYRDEARRSDVIRARHDIDVKVIHSECLWIIDNITT